MTAITPALGSPFDGIGKREKRIRRQHRAGRALLGFADCYLDRVYTAHLSCPHAAQCSVAAQHDRIGFDVTDECPGKPQLLPDGFRRGLPGHNSPFPLDVGQIVGFLHEQAASDVP